METIYFQRIKEIKKEKEDLEKKLGVKITIQGKKVFIEGNTFKEYEAALVLEAINFGFSAKKSLILKNGETVFRKIPIKNFTRRKNLIDVKARILGTEGKTKRAMEEISSCWILLKDNTIGILGPAESIEEATTAITNLIRGSKQSNVYRFLERINTERKKYKK